MAYPVWSVKAPFGPPPRMSAEAAEADIMATAAEMTLIGVVIDPDELALIRSRKEGEISREQFLEQLSEVTLAKLRAAQS